jgi:hypothetical protein
VKALKIVGIVLAVYVGIVVVFESLLGYFQPGGDYTMVITTTSADGDTNPRVVAKLESDGKLYAAANHWPRAWYHQALESPDVTVAIGETTGEYTAVPVSGAEHERVDSEYPLGPVFRTLTGFPPRYFVRLDPKQ